MLGVDTFDITLRPGEEVVARAPSVRVHFQREGDLTAYKMRCKLLLTSDRLVGMRRFFRQRQTTPDVERHRIRSVEVVTTLEMRGVSRTGMGDTAFVRMQVADPGGVLALAMPAAQAAEWAEHLADRGD